MVCVRGQFDVIGAASSAATLPIIA